MPVALGPIAGTWAGRKTQAIPVAWKLQTFQTSRQHIVCCSGKVLQCPASLSLVIEVTRGVVADRRVRFQRSDELRNATSSTTARPWRFIGQCCWPATLWPALGMRIRQL